jgi:2',3'-cyclic-nucleotide 2'-phosphodiesterase (5'-nucleotidase family)
LKMRSFGTKRIVLVFVIVLALLVNWQYSTQTTQAVTTEIVIFHTNDTHGRVVNDGKSVIGIDRVAAIRKSVPNSILVDAGDAFHGLPIATLSKGADITALMNEAGYNAMAVGNHEFDYGFERLLELRDMARFPILSANIKKDGATLVQGSAMIEANGVKIGVFGITTEATAYSTMPQYVSGLVFEDPVKTARETAEALRKQGAQVVVALCHLGVTPYDGTLSTELAQKASEIDVIIDGHSHSALKSGLLENGVLIAQKGEYTNNLGKVTITLEKGRITSKTALLIDYAEAQKTVPDATVAAKLSEITTGLDAVLKVHVGSAIDGMSSVRAPGIRTQEMPLGSLVADAYREAAEADIAVANGGDIRADLVKGTITNGDIISILPYGNTLMVKMVTPVVLRQALENGVSGMILDEQGKIDHGKSEQGKYLQVSGFSFTYDPTAPVGARVVSITLNDGRVLSLSDNETRFSLVGTNFVMNGNEFYTMLGELPLSRELGAADEALAEYVRKHSPIVAPKEGRIIVIQESEMEEAA